MYFFKDFINKFTTYKIRVLFAIKDKKDFISIKEISLVTGFSVKTIDFYINSIYEDYLQFKEKNDHFNLIISPQKKIMVYYSLYEDFHSFILFLYEQCYSVQLLTKLFLGEKITISQHLSEYFISNATFKRRISAMRPVLNNYLIEIKNRKGLLYLAGDEKQIRILAYMFFWSLYKGQYWPFKNVDKAKTIGMQKRVFPKSYNHFGKTNIEEASFILAVNIERYHKKYLINYEKNWYTQFFSEENLPNIKLPQDPYELDYNEYLFFIVVLQTQAKVYLTDHFRIQSVTFHQKNNTVIHQSIRTFFKLFSEQVYPIPPEKESFLYPFLLANHIYCTLFKNFSTGITSYPEIYDEKNSSPILEQKLKLLLDQLYLTTGNELFKESQFLISRYVLLFSSLKKITYFESKISILIDTDLSILAENRIVKQLQNTFSESYNINIIKSFDLKNEERFDIVITTSFLSTIKKLSFSGSSVIYIPNELRLEDMHRIKKLLHSVHLKKGTNY